MPGASCLKIDKKKGSYSIERYWNYAIYEDVNIASLEQAADCLFLILDQIFSKLDKKKYYVMGLSGGLDSRVTLAFLNKHIGREHIKLFTYGFNENILEHQYALAVANALGLEKPSFHLLSTISYREALSYLPASSGGHISINHCHIIDYLRANALAGYRQISTYFSDAIFGYECCFPKRLQCIKNNYYSAIMSKQPDLSPVIKQDILSDALKIYAGFDDNANYSSLDEFRYITERNQKFHMLLSSLQNQYLATDLVYANMALLTYMLSVPVKFRYNKQIINVVLNKYFSEIGSGLIDNISSRDFKKNTSYFQWVGKLNGWINWMVFRFINRVNSVLRISTGGKYQIHNKFQTEEHERALYGELRNALHEATGKFVEMGLLTKKQKQAFDKLPVRSAGVSERYALISLAKIL